MPSINLIRGSDGNGNASVATVQATRSPMATTIQVNTTTNWPTTFIATMGTPHTYVDPVTSEQITIISEATAVDFKGHLDGGNIEIDSIAPGYTDLGSSVGDIVIVKPTTAWADEISDVLDVSHNDDGSINATSPQVSTSINDSNDNELIKLVEVASAVNEVEITNAATGDGPKIVATGDDTDINLLLGAKGAGLIELLSGFAGTGLSDSIETGSNGGSGGGNTNHLNLGGIHICWGKTAQSGNIATNSVVSRVVNLPYTYSAAPYGFATLTNITADNRLIPSVTSTTTTVLNGQIASADAGATARGALFWLTIGV